VHLPRLPIPAMSPKRSASTSPEPSTSSSDVGSDSSSSDGEQLPAHLLGTRSGRTSRPSNRHVPSPGKLKSDTAAETAARRASGEAAAAKRQSLHNGSLDKEEHRESRCGVEYDCPDGACGPNGC
jgi:hypothetical protein